MKNISKEMYCPLCRSLLSSGVDVRYETLDHHISDPDGEIYPAPTVVCTNTNCLANQKNIFWADSGEGPYNTSFGDEKAIPWIDNNPIPFGSFHRQIYFSVDYDVEDSRFTFGKLTIKRKVRYDSSDFGYKIDKRVSYSIWWNNILWHSGIRMLIFVLKRFYFSYDRKREAGEIIERSKWPRAEWWRKTAAWWVQKFHPQFKIPNNIWG